MGFYVPSVNPSPLKINGITKDSTGAPLAGCRVELFDSVTDALEKFTTSDESGAFSFDVAADRVFYLGAISPDGLLIGGTLENLTGTLTGS